MILVYRLCRCRKLHRNRPADHFRGGGGNDIYTGGLGKDSFGLTQTETSIITITDFEVGEGDILVFDSTYR